jgi:F-type H+-transporting ATPase subunit O
MGAHRGEIDLNITSAQVRTPRAVFRSRKKKERFKGYMLKLRPQELDAKTISRLEKAVSKSQFSQGKKLKVVAKVRCAG